MAVRGPKAARQRRETPLEGCPEPPPGLDDAAAEHWQLLTGLLSEARLLSRLDRDALHLYMTAWSRYRRAEAHLEDEGDVVTGTNGCLQKNPWYQVSRDAARAIAAYLDLFGLTPRARGRLTFPPAKGPTSKWDKFRE